MCLSANEGIRFGAEQGDFGPPPAVAALQTQAFSLCWFTSAFDPTIF